MKKKFLVFTFLLLWAGTAFADGIIISSLQGAATIALGTTVTSYTDSDGTVGPMSHTVDAGTDLLIVLAGGFYFGGAIDSACGGNYQTNVATWNTTETMTSLCPPTDGTWLTDTAMVIYYRAAPTAGTHNITFGTGSAPTSGTTFIAVNVKNVNTTVGASGIRDTESDSQDSGTATATLTTVSGDMVLRISVADDTSIVSESGTTVEYGPTVFNSSVVLVGWKLASDVTHSATNTVTGSMYPGIFAISVASD